VTIRPDTKDWTWVLERPCPACGLDATVLAAADLPKVLRDAAREFADVLLSLGEAARRRPAPGVWSPLEYGCHVRDAVRRADARTALMLTTEDPVFENWDQDAAAVEDAYGEQDPARVAAELVEAADRLARTHETLPATSWERTGRRSDGAPFTVLTLGRYFAHDLVHHLHDVTGARPGITPR
jgi:DinB superfamily